MLDAVLIIEGAITTVFFQERTIKALQESPISVNK